MNFNDVAIGQVFDKIISYAMSTGRFDVVNQHEPKNSPGTGMTCALWAQSISPARSSGLNATSGTVLFNARVYTSFRSQPFDMIDPNVMAATCDIMGALSGDFDLGGIANVRAVDLLGMAGTPLQATAGYVEIDKQMLRVMTITIPVLINDMFSQVALWFARRDG